MSELPRGWALTTIGEILQPQADGKLIHQGWSPQCHSEPAGDGQWGVLKTTAIQDGYFLEEYNKKLPIDKEPKPRIEVKDGDLLMTNAGPRTRCGVTTLVRGVRENLMISGKMYRMRFNESYIFPGYIEACFRSEAVTKEIDSRKTGISESGLNLTQARFLTVPIKICPYHEQIRIAEKLGSLLSKVSKAQSRLENIPAILKRFRKSVFASATSGELTSEWRGGNESSEWVSVKLIDVIQVKPRNGHSPKGVDYETDVKNLTLSAITKGYFVEGKYKYVDLDVSKDSYLWVKNGDLLIQRANSLEYVGVSVLYEGKDDLYIYPDLIMKCRANEKILSKYLHYSLLSEKVRRYFRDNATGTSGNMPKINQGVVSSAPIFLPGLEEQTEIVRRVESLLTLVDVVDRQYNEVKLRLDRLTQSILAKAFRGELVPQDQDDESATLLLQRVSESQNVGMGSKKSTKMKSVKKKKVSKVIKAGGSIDAGSDVSISSKFKASPRNSSETIDDEIFEKLSEIYNGVDVDVESLFKGMNRPYEETKKALFKLLKGDLNGALKPKARLSWDGAYKIKVLK